jgi:hypothetical protein
MALNPIQNISNGMPASPPNALNKPLAGSSPPAAGLSPAPPDQFQQSSAPSPAATDAPSNAPPQASAPRFGGSPAATGPGPARKAAAVGLGVLSGVGLAVAIPFGLLQMAVGIVIHPLLITGAVTMALPFLGMLGSILLMGHKK